MHYLQSATQESKHLDIQKNNPIPPVVESPSKFYHWIYETFIINLEFENILQDIWERDMLIKCPFQILPNNVFAWQI